MFIVIELQTNANGQVSNVVTAFLTIEQAYNKYFTILATAAVSSVPVHAATILNNFGEEIEHKAFEHKVVSE